MSRAALGVRPLAPRKAKLRAAVFDRDQGVCSLCRRDTEEIRRRLYALRADSFGSMRKSNELREFLAELRELGMPTSGSMWEADHFPALIEGGQDNLAGLRTLCTPCHRLETKVLAARRARRPQAKRGA